MSDTPRAQIIREEDGATRLLVAGKPFFMLAGEVHNSAASCPEHMRRHVWPRVRALRCNSIFAPVYWELMEPEEGVFDFAHVYALVTDAREHGVKLCLLWFAAWKNSHSTYAPDWVRRDCTRFRRVKTISGDSTKILSSFCDETREADANAFAALMRRVREIDSDAASPTVIAVQLENEVGVLGAPRDYSAEAETRFAEDVPAELLRHLAEHPPRAGEVAPVAESGAWARVFGADADEAFMAWHYARHIQRVAESGKAELDLPMFANAWLMQSPGQPAGEYPSGGPVSRVMEIWKAAAPALFTLAPDIYLPDFAAVCADYARPDNPLLIPEAVRDDSAAAKMFYAFGAHHALGFSPFGIETLGADVQPDITGPAPDGSQAACLPVAAVRYAEACRLLGGMMPLLGHLLRPGRSAGFLKYGDSATAAVSLGGVSFVVRWRDGAAQGGGMLLLDDDGAFLLLGHGLRLDISDDGAGDSVHCLLRHEEGEFDAEGRWRRGRVLNGDEFALALGDMPELRRFTLYERPR